jgi:HlyD family secretion protein
MATHKSKPRWPLIIVSVVLLILIGSCVGLGFVAQNTAEMLNQALGSVQVIDTVERRDISDDVVLNGKLEPVERAELGFGATSRLAEVLVAPGDRVRKDQPLARLETRDLELAVVSAQAALVQAEASLAKLNAGPNAQEVANAQQQMIAAQGGVVQAQQAAASAQLQRERAQITARDQLEQARNQLAQQQAQAQQQRAQASLAKTNAERTLAQLTDALIRAQSTYSTAQWRLDYVERTGFAPETEGQPRETRIKLNSFQREEFRTQLAQAEVALRDAERAVEQGQVVYEQAQRDEVTQVQQIDIQLRTAEQAFRQREAELLAQISPSELAQVQPDQAQLAQAIIEEQRLQRQAERSAATSAAASLATAQAQKARLFEGAAAADVADAQARLARSQSELAQAEARLARATLRAPFDGLVVAVNRRAGETVAEDGSVIALVRNDQLTLSGTVDELAVLNLVEGQLAPVQVDALPTQIMTGTLTEVAVAPLASSQAQAGLNTASDSASRYAVRVLIEQPNELARLGMAATARVIIQNRPNALVLPLRAIRDENGQTFVERVIPDPNAIEGAIPTTERVNVTLGVRTPNGVEILSGLQEGDRVVSQTAPPAQEGGNP